LNPLSRLSLRSQIALTAVATTACALIAVRVLIAPQIRQNYIQQTQTALLADARLMARIVAEPLSRDATLGELDSLVDDAAREIRARATIIALDGRVLADSAVSGEALRRLEDHSGRPEVIEALAAGSGTALRMSGTVEQQLIYAAVPIRVGDRSLGVARVALSRAGVEAQVQELLGVVALSLAVAFAIAVLLSAPLSASVLSPLYEAMEVARRFATGNLSPRIQIRGSREISELGQIMNRSADQLQERFDESQRDRGRVAAMLSAMEEGVLAVDHSGNVLVANDSLRRWLELDSPVGHPYDEVIARDKISGEISRVIESVLRHGSRTALEVELPRLARVFAVVAVPFPDTEGKPHGAILTFHDVTERRRNDQVRRDFVANASHELRTPLTSIRGFAEALQDGAAEDATLGPRFLQKIRTHADRMSALVEDLLELSRMESGDHPPNWEEVALDPLIEEVTNSFSGRAASKSLGLTRTGPGCPAVVTDSERLTRILENLVDNAIKYTPAGGHVEIYCGGAEDGGAQMEVRDDGPGIPAQHLSRLFERFYRVDKARSRDLGGTGLGLSIVRHLAEGIGASVGVTSEVGRGTRFSVRLPKHASAGPKARFSSRRMAGSEANTR
jgi:two-component system phosphate regulon sensor histidine kinase PhoR